MGLFDKIKARLGKSRENLAEKVEALVVESEVLDDDFFDELTDILILADVGMKTTVQVVVFDTAIAVLAGLMVLGGMCFAAEWPQGCSPAQPYSHVPEVNLSETMGYIMMFPRGKLPAARACACAGHSVCGQRHIPVRLDRRGSADRHMRVIDRDRNRDGKRQAARACLCLHIH